jgi:hypothetical protein
MHRPGDFAFLAGKKLRGWVEMLGFRPLVVVVDPFHLARWFIPRAILYYAMSP